MAGPTVAFQTGIHSARPAANSGIVIYACTTHNKLELSNGSTFSDLADLAGSGIQATIADAKGDLIVGTAADTVARLAVGSNDTIPMADSGQSTGIKWVASQTPSTQAFSDAAAEGTADTYARGDHKHGMMASPGGGGGSDPIADAFGTPDTAYEFGSNDFTGLTAHGTADTESMHTTVAGHLLLGDDDGSQVGRWATVSGASTMIVKLTDYVSFYNYQYVGVFAGVNPPGKMVFLGLQGGASPAITMKTFSSPSDGSPGTPSPILLRTPLTAQAYAPWYFGIRAASSTDISYYVSRTGVVWQPVLLNHNNSMTLGSFGVTLSNYAGDGVQAQGAYDYIRIWNSAKTFPAFS